jgi:hypothetical protein
MHLGRPQRVAAKVKPKQTVAERDLVLDLGVQDRLTAGVARITLTVAARGLHRLLPRQVIRDNLVQNAIDETPTRVH